ncbi:hypothetical protein [Candidatus Parabeggiatoa sp. HSG14]|uniref:hypothetical protein n=1 Tax=Candidatus Parabeggiatoa sp. HSG14 TaxID=3055593 RepID=UPI0025A79314|nr:hypothetical protein [Thiotrichales bacterium HSG14]
MGGFRTQISVFIAGHNLGNSKTWLRLNEKREQHPSPLLHKELITTSKTAINQLSIEVFISYSRKDSDFSRLLNTTITKIQKNDLV